MTEMIHGVIALAIGLAISLGVPSSLHSQEDPQQEELRAAAKQHFLAGRADFAEGKYGKALESFRAANTRVPSFVLQFNIGRCLEESLRLDEARDAFALVVRHADDAALAAEAQARIDAITARAERSGVRVLNPRLGVRVIIDGVGASLDPTGFVSVSPGTRRVEIWQPFHRPHLHYLVIGSEEVKAITLAPLSKERLGATAGEAPLDGEAVREAGFLRRNWPALSTIGLGLVGLGVGVTLRVMGQAEWDAIHDAARDEEDRIIGMSEREAVERSERGDRYELVSAISFGVAGLSFLGSALLVALDVPGSDPVQEGPVARPRIRVLTRGLSLDWSW
jgi:tetratricopeptide (TPR) repeat protein